MNYFTAMMFFLSFSGLANRAQLLGHANEFKEGDVTIGVAASSEEERQVAKKYLAEIKIRDIHEHPVYEDEQQALIWKTTDPKAYRVIKNWSLGRLKNFLLTQPEEKIKAIMPGLDSDVIACIVKLMSNEELIQVGQKIFNPLPGSQIGAKGYMGARIQPNSPTDDPEEIAWQVFNGFSYAVGDVLLGTNPVDSTLKSVFLVEKTLKDIVEVFGLKEHLAWSVLAHVDVQNEVERANTGSTDLFFQSLAGVESANRTFGISTKKMMQYARSRQKQKHGFYFETGQGADFTNGHGHGFDMVVHESRKYGFARAMKQQTAWVILNDVAGFIGPEVFKTREQLVRVCLEDIVMGKLHGLTIGLDICSTLHMSVSLDDLEWCQDQIMPANPAYLMALPTRNDPMLSYLTTSFKDHVRIRDKFGYKVNDAMWEFFKTLGVIDTEGKPTEHFGDAVWVYVQYRIKKGDLRPFEIIYAEGKKNAESVQKRGVPLDLGQPELEAQIHALYDDAKKSIWAEFTPEFIKSIPNHVVLHTQSKDRADYIGHPQTGEKLLDIKVPANGKFDIQIVISDGLNARALMEPGHLEPYLLELRKLLGEKGLKVAPENFVVIGGRVRAGYQIGEILFSGPSDTRKTIVHVIGERPGNGHQTFSAYITTASMSVWGQKGVVDHNITRLVSGISDTSLEPKEAALETVKLLW